MSIPQILSTHGPCTGAELLALVKLDVLSLWKACLSDPDLLSHRIGRRYLRLDRQVDGYARLSPSIRREFLTYTLIGLPSQTEQMEVRGRELERSFADTSRRKREIALQAMVRILDASPDRDELEDHLCCLIGGDVVYGMAHTVRRLEPSTRRPVRGSDLDIIVVADETLPQELVESFDEAVYQEKWTLLVLPQYREEIDYVVKDITTVRRQLQFDTFRHMVASKILFEAEWLCGSKGLYQRLKRLVEESGVPQKLARLQERATEDRVLAERKLIELSEEYHDEAWHHLFFTTQEREEIY